MKKILIIEDDSFLQDLEVEKLEKNGFELITASTGKEALEKINEPDISLFVLDLTLPDTDGFEILKKIKGTETIKKIPVIVFSNMSEEKYKKEAMELGAIEFMIKSNFTLDELVDKIKTILK